LPSSGLGTVRLCWNTSRALRIPSAPRVDTAELEAGSASARNEDPGRRVGRLGLPSSSMSTGRGARSSAVIGGVAVDGEEGTDVPGCKPGVGRRGRAPGFPSVVAAGEDGEDAGGGGVLSVRWTGSWLTGRRRSAGMGALFS